MARRPQVRRDGAALRSFFEGVGFDIHNLALRPGRLPHCIRNVPGRVS